MAGVREWMDLENPTVDRVMTVMSTSAVASPRAAVPAVLMRRAASSTIRPDDPAPAPFVGVHR
jgi:hypothetical protein